MNQILSIVFIIICTISAITKNHKVNVFLSIFSIVCDTFYLNYGGLNFLLIYFIAYLNIPTLLVNKIFINKEFNRLIKYFRLEFLYLILLGLVFGFLIPWEDKTGTRLWNQTAEGRTIVQLFRLLSEFIVLYYIAFLIQSKKIDLKFIVVSFAVSSLISFWVGFIDYFLGYSLKNAMFDLGHFESIRFLGLNGEPKALGRAGAISYAIILLYIKYSREKSFLLIFSLITNIFAVVLSSSASSYILFALLNLIIFLNYRAKDILLAGIVVTGLFFTYNFLQSNDYLQDQTNNKVKKALFGSEENWISNEPSLFKRFDIFDRLALIFLWENPIYAFTGVGPNLISIPMSKYIPESSTFYILGRVDSVPNVMFNNILSRSGIVGIFLFLMGILKFLNHSRTNLPNFYTKLFIAILIFNIVYLNVTLYFIIGILTGSLTLRKKEITSVIKHYQ